MTDIARYKNPEEPNVVVANWMRNRNTIEYLGIWEQLYNADFKPLEFEGFLNQAGANAFTLSPMKWIESTNAIGIVTRKGRGGGTYAHKDIAFKFAAWLSAEFELYIVKDYQRLKTDENSRLSMSWNLNREIAKINYRIHTDAIKGNLIPPELTPEQISYTYASEADLLHVALFGQRTKQWRDKNPGKKGNMRDEANLNQLLVLANMESYNAVLIEQGRLEFQKMLNDIQEGKDDVSFVLVFKLTRFGWNAADVLNSLQLMQDFGVNLICVEDGLDSSKDSGKLWFYGQSLRVWLLAVSGYRILSR